MKLIKWSEKNPADALKLSAELGKQNYHRYRQEKRIPDKDAMAIIVRLTKHQVTANDFYDVDPKKAAAALAAAG